MVLKLVGLILVKKLLEKTNFTPKLISKIESLASPKRLSLNKYRKILLETTDLCFYCEKPLVENQIDVDHFIPWSYIFDLIGTF